MKCFCFSKSQKKPWPLKELHQLIFTSVSLSWMFTPTCRHSYTQTRAHIHLLSTQPWSSSDVIVVLIRKCIEFLIRKPFLIVKWLLLLPPWSESSDREPVAGDAYRQEVRENHLGTKGTENVLLAGKSTPCAACHRNPIGLCVLCCLFIWFLGVILILGRALTVQNGFAELCSTAGVWQL